MSLRATVLNWKQAVSRILRLAARPVRTAQGGGGVVLQPYRGYGSPIEVFLIGRIFQQSQPDTQGPQDTLRAQLRDIGRRIARRSVAGVLVTARFYGAEERVTTDQDGYFRVHLAPQYAPPSDRAWHVMDLTLEQPQPVQAQAQVFIPPASCRYVVISDIDDTIMKTGVANKLRMLWRLFVQDAQSRVAFPGVAALYRALHTGKSGQDANPLLYVSRAPWGIYDVLDAFFRLHAIPVGPILFLREWGLSWTSPLPRRAEDHKRELIHNMLALYSDLPFVLIGDSGQHDPEVYRRIVEEHPGRVLAVYIRNVSRSTTRIQEIEALAKVVAGAGSSLLLASDSMAMAEHAAKLGLISSEALAEVRSERDQHKDVEPQGATRRVERRTADGTVAAVAQGELKQALSGGSQSTPPSVLVEPAEREREPRSCP